MAPLAATVPERLVKMDNKLSDKEQNGREITRMMQNLVFTTLRGLHSFTDEHYAQAAVDTRDLL